MTLLIPLFLAVSANSYALENFADSKKALHLAVPRTAPFANDGVLESVWDRIIDESGARDALFGVSLLGPDPYERNPRVVFTPASNTKIFTAAAALELLGPAFQLSTRIEWRDVAGEPGAVTGLTLYGSGDPTWGMSEFGEDYRTRVREIARALRGEGIREVHGAIHAVAADPRWNEIRFPEGWAEEDFTSCYGAQAQAFNLQINCAEYVIRGPRAGAWKEEAVPVQVAHEIRAGRETALSVHAVHAPGVQAASFKVTGTWAAGSRPVSFILPVHDVAGWVRALLAAALAEEGIRLVSTQPRLAEPMVRRLAVHSPPLDRFLIPFMKKSINVVGEAIFKIMGQLHGDAELPLLDAGRKVMEGFVSGIGARTARRYGVEPEPGFYSRHATLWDGSGVSRSNSVTPEVVLAVMMDLIGDDDFAPYWESLPIAGVDGTLENRMKGTAAEGVLRAKTGTLRGVYNLSGYVPRFDAVGTPVEHVPFVVLTRADPRFRQDARATQDRLGAALVEVINGGLEAMGL